MNMESGELRRMDDGALKRLFEKNPDVDSNSFYEHMKKNFESVPDQMQDKAEELLADEDSVTLEKGHEFSNEMEKHLLQKRADELDKLLRDN